MYAVKQHIVDLDVIDITEHTVNQQIICYISTGKNEVTASLISDNKKVNQAVLKLDAKPCSVSVSRPKGSQNKLVVAIACFDKCMLTIYGLSVIDNGTALKFSDET